MIPNSGRYFFIFFCEENDRDEMAVPVSSRVYDDRQRPPHSPVLGKPSIQRQLSTHLKVQTRTRPILGVDGRPTAVGCDPAGISRRVHSAQDPRAPG